MFRDDVEVDETLYRGYTDKSSTISISAKLTESNILEDKEIPIELFLHGLRREILLEDVDKIIKMAQDFKTEFQEKKKIFKALMEHKRNLMKEQRSEKKG